MAKAKAVAMAMAMAMAMAKAMVMAMVREENTLTTEGLTGKRKKEELGDSHGKKKDHMDSYLETKTSKSSSNTLKKKKKNFTLLVMPIDKILMQIKDEPGLKWPKPLSRSSRKRDPKKYCRFHKDHGHYTDECRNLKEQIEELIQRGKLQKFIKRDHHPRARADDKSHDDVKDDGRDHPKQAIGEIRTIIGGPMSEGSYKSLKKTYYRQINSGIKQPHNDPLVIMLEIEGFKTRRVLVDNGSSADIMYMMAYQQLRLDPKKLRPFNSPLVSFSGDKIYPRGIVSLLVTDGTYPSQVTNQVDFLIVNCPLSYNVILGRLMLN
nr:uncharacterized protein LOC112013123 [Quercus suber]